MTIRVDVFASDESRTANMQAALWAEGHRDDCVVLRGIGTSCGCVTRASIHRALRPLLGDNPQIPEKLTARLHGAGLLRTCLTCDHFVQTGELCRLTNPMIRPPAKVIAYGCPAWQCLRDDVPF